MESMFHDCCDEQTKMAEVSAMEWMSENWEIIETMFSEINVPNVIIVTRSTLKTHEQQLLQHFQGHSYILSRLPSYTHHSGDYYPKDTKFPFLMLNDPDMKGHVAQESTHLASIARQMIGNTFFIVIQTTKREARIEKRSNIYWLTLPKYMVKNDITYEANRIAEIAALLLFGETRYRGFLSMLWMDSRYDVIENINNRHFTQIIQESLISPFYLSPNIFKHAILMGFRYEDANKTRLPKRKMSPMRRKKSKTTLKSKPRVTRPPSPQRVSTPEIEPILSLNIEEPELEEEETFISQLPPSPTRAKLPPPSPKRKKKSSENTKPKDTKPKKFNPKNTGTIINPRTGRKVKVGGLVYQDLVSRGIIDAV